MLFFFYIIPYMYYSISICFLSEKNTFWETLKMFNIIKSDYYTSVGYGYDIWV